MFDPFTAHDFQNALAMWDTFRLEDDAATIENADEPRDAGDRNEQ